MINISIDDFHDAVFSILVPHSSYIHDVNDDHIRYMIPAEVVSALTWMITDLVVPTLVGVTVSVVSDKLKARKHSIELHNREKELAKREEELKAMRVSIEELVQLRNEVQSALHALRPAVGTRTPDHEIISAVTQVLIINGWPLQAAEQDAKQVLEECICRLYDE